MPAISIRAERRVTDLWVMARLLVQRSSHRRVESLAVGRSFAPVAILANSSVFGDREAWRRFRLVAVAVFRARNIGFARGWTADRPIGAEHAAVSRQRLELRPAGLALVKNRQALAGIGSADRCPHFGQVMIDRSLMSQRSSCRRGKHACRRSTTVSISSVVVPRPRLKRMAPTPTAGGTPIASSTADNLTRPK